MIHNPSPFTATMKLLLTWPKGFRSAMSSTLGSAAGVSAARKPSPATAAVQACAPAEKSRAPIAWNCSHREISRSGAPVHSNPAAAPAPSPKEVGITPRGGPGNDPGIADERKAGSIAAAPAANAVEPPFAGADLVAVAAAVA